MPIVFYGKLEDQFGNPVGGANVAASVRIYNGFRSTVERFNVVSDADGFFHIDHGKGEALGIAPSKDGYVLATPDTYFKYSYMLPDRSSPDAQNPTVIKLWKLQGAEPLVSIDQRFQFPFTGEPVRFDLLAGKIVANGGDLKIAVSRPVGIISQQHPQKWSIDFKVVDGGFIETSGRESAITFAAPETGYQLSGEFENNNGPDMVDKAFFVQSRNGKVFSRLHIWFRINNSPDGLISVTIRGIANTNSSRNWEATAPQK